MLYKIITKQSRRIESAEWGQGLKCRWVIRKGLKEKVTSEPRALWAFRE